MTYPAIPLANNHPAWLVSIDPTYFGGIFPSVGGNPFNAMVGGLSGLPGPSSGGSIIQVNQAIPMTSWAANPGSIGPLVMVQRIGRRFNWILLNGNTYGSAS